MATNSGDPKIFATEKELQDAAEKLNFYIARPREETDPKIFDKVALSNLRKTAIQKPTPRIQLMYDEADGKVSDVKLELGKIKDIKFTCTDFTAGRPNPSIKLHRLEMHLTEDRDSEESHAVRMFAALGAVLDEKIRQSNKLDNAPNLAEVSRARTYKSTNKNTNIETWHRTIKFKALTYESEKFGRETTKTFLKDIITINKEIMFDISGEPESGPIETVADMIGAIKNPNRYGAAGVRAGISSLNFVDVNPYAPETSTRSAVTLYPEPIFLAYKPKSSKRSKTMSEEEREERRRASAKVAEENDE